MLSVGGWSWGGRFSSWGSSNQPAVWQRSSSVSGCVCPARPAPSSRRPSCPLGTRFFRLSLSGLAAQLQSGAFRRVVGGGAPRNRAVFLAFGVGLGLIEQQLEEDRTSAALCQEIQVKNTIT